MFALRSVVVAALAISASAFNVKPGSTASSTRLNFVDDEEVLTLEEISTIIAPPAIQEVEKYTRYHPMGYAAKSHQQDIDMTVTEIMTNYYRTVEPTTEFTGYSAVSHEKDVDMTVKAIMEHHQ